MTAVERVETSETLDKQSLERGGFDVSDKLGTLHEGFESSVAPEGGVYAFPDAAAISKEITQAAVSSVRDMYYGTDIGGRTSLGLKEISGWQLNPDFYEQNLSQHAGYAAEVISTAKENFAAQLSGTGEITYRADDMPEALRKQLGDRIAVKNDQFVDKVRIKADGKYETVQTKFVGKDAADCLSKLTSKKFEKYLGEGSADKLEIPKEYYDDVKKMIPEKRDKLLDQLDRVSAADKPDEAAKLRHKLDKLETLDNKLEQSCVTKKEAVYAVEHPKLYSAKQLNVTAVKHGAAAAGSAALKAGYENYQKYAAGEISGEEAITDTIKDAALSGGLTYLGTIAAKAAGKAAAPVAVGLTALEVAGDVKELAEGTIDGRKFALKVTEDVLDNNLVGAVVRVGIESADDFGDYLDGKIDTGELVYNIGENAAKVAGEMILGEDGGYVAVEIYDAAVDEVTKTVDTAVEAGKELADTVADKASEIGDSVSSALGSAADTVKGWFGDQP